MLLEKIKNFYFYKKAEGLYKKYERFIMPLALILGFLLDAATFKTIDIFTNFILLLFYALCAGACIFFINFYEARAAIFSGRIVNKLRLYAPVVMQFCFGALLSMSFVFYSFDGVFSISWPLVLMLLFLMVANEIFKNYYKNPIVQLSALFFVWLTLLGLLFPFVFNSVGSSVFIFGELSAAALFAFFTFVLAKFSVNIRSIYRQVALIAVVIFGFMNFLYFANIVPPMPLVMREGGAYHNVQKINGAYEVWAERESFWYKFFLKKTMHIAPGTVVYIYSAVFSPADLNTEITHHWQKYDEAEKKWVTVNKLSFWVTGGRYAGYRGYSKSARITPGRWRVYVETSRGQKIGKISFTAFAAEIAPETEKILK